MSRSSVSSLESFNLPHKRRRVEVHNKIEIPKCIRHLENEISRVKDQLEDLKKQLGVKMRHLEILEEKLHDERVALRREEEDRSPFLVENHHRRLEVTADEGAWLVETPDEVYLSEP